MSHKTTATDEKMFWLRCCYHNHLFYCYSEREMFAAIHNIFLQETNFYVFFCCRVPRTLSAVKQVIIHTRYVVWGLETVWLMLLIHYDYDSAARLRISKGALCDRCCNRLPQPFRFEAWLKDTFLRIVFPLSRTGRASLAFMPTASSNEKWWFEKLNFHFNRHFKFSSPWLQILWSKKWKELRFYDASVSCNRI